MAKTLQARFRKKFGERGYTAMQVSLALRDFDWIDHRKYTDRKIRRHVKNNNLVVDLKEAGIQNPVGSIRYLVKESDLEALIAGMKMGVSVEDMQFALEKFY